MPGQQVFVPTVAAHLPSHGHCVQGVAGTYTAHLPWVQISLGAHVTPHAPQYGRFFVRSTQAVLPPTSHGVVSQIAWDRGACSAVLGIAEEIWTSHVVAIGQSAQTRTMGLLAIPVMCASLIAAAAVDRIVAKVKAPSVARGEPAGASVQSASRAAVGRARVHDGADLVGAVHQREQIQHGVGAAPAGDEEQCPAHGVQASSAYVATRWPHPRTAGTRVTTEAAHLDPSPAGAGQAC